MATSTDNFTEASNLSLTLHTPDSGGSWSELENTDVTAPIQSGRVRATEGTLDVNNATTGVRILWQVSWTPAAADYDVLFTVKGSVPGGSDDPIWLLARIADLDNYYFAGSYQGGAAADKKLGKKVSGAVTELASGDNGIAVNDILKFELRGSTLKLYQNGVEILSATDSALAAAGKAGLGEGNVLVAGDDVSTWQLDVFQLIDAAGTLFTQTVAGTLTSAGALARQTQRALTGSASAAGALVKQEGKVLTGILTSSGALVRQARTVLLGAVAFAGAVVRSTQRGLTGAVPSSGALVATKTALLSLAATVSTSGAIARLTGKAAAGAFSSSGALSKASARSLEGTVGASGAMARQTQRAVSAAISFVTTVAGVVLQLVIPKPGVLRLTASYEPALTLAGVYAPTLQITGGYDTTIALTGAPPVEG